MSKYICLSLQNCFFFTNITGHFKSYSSPKYMLNTYISRGYINLERIQITTIRKMDKLMINSYSGILQSCTINPSPLYILTQFSNYMMSYKSRTGAQSSMISFIYDNSKAGYSNILIRNANTTVKLVFKSGEIIHELKQEAASEKRPGVRQVLLSEHR